MIESFPFNKNLERKEPEKKKVPLKDKIEELLREEIEKEERGDRTEGHTIRLSLLRSLSTVDDPEKFIRDRLSKIEMPGKIKTYQDNVSENLLKEILRGSETGLQQKVESEASPETSLNNRIKNKIKELLEEVEKKEEWERNRFDKARLSLLRSLSEADNPEEVIRNRLSELQQLELKSGFLSTGEQEQQKLLEEILKESGVGLQESVVEQLKAGATEGPPQGESTLEVRQDSSGSEIEAPLETEIAEIASQESGEQLGEAKPQLSGPAIEGEQAVTTLESEGGVERKVLLRNKIKELLREELEREKMGDKTESHTLRLSLLQRLSTVDDPEKFIKDELSKIEEAQGKRRTYKDYVWETLLKQILKESETQVPPTQAPTTEAPTTEAPTEAEIPPPPSLDRIRLEDVLDVEFHRERAKRARSVLNQRERAYLREIRSKERCYQEKDNTEKQKCLADAKMRIENALIAVEEARDNYKFSLYYSHFSEKAQQIMYRLWEDRLVKEGRLPKTKKERQELWQEERDDFIKNNKDLIENNLFTPQERNLIVSRIAWEMLQRHENLYMQAKNIEEEIRRSNNWLARIMERYRSLPYSSKVLMGAAIAGASAGALGIAGGAGFAALGIGAVAALRRFAGGFFVGGPIKALSELIIGRKERREIEKTRETGVQEAIQTVEEALENPELREDHENKVLEAMRHLDKRLDQIVRDSENIRGQSDRRRRLWTAIAILAGGIASNIDNIWELFKGAKGAVEEKVLSEVPGSKEVVTAYSPEAVKTFPPESAITTPETAIPTHTESIVEMSHETLNGIKVGKGGFWEAAKSLKRTLGLDDRTFESAWSKSLVQTQEGTLPISEAHYVVGDATLSYDIKENVFRVITTSKTKIGNLFDLINDYKRLGKRIPIWIMKWLRK